MRQAAHIDRYAPPKGMLSMAQVDEISSKLGGLEKMQELILRSVNAIEQTTDKMNETLILAKASAESAHDRIDNIEPRINTLEKTESQRQGAWRVIVWGGGIIGTVAGGIAGFLGRMLWP